MTAPMHGLDARHAKNGPQNGLLTGTWKLEAFMHKDMYTSVTSRVLFRETYTAEPHQLSALGRNVRRREIERLLIPRGVLTGEWPV